MKSAKVITKMLSGKGVKTMGNINSSSPLVYVSLSELKAGEPNYFYIGNYEAIDVQRVKYKIIVEDDEKDIVEKLYDVMSKKNSTV